MTTTVRTPKACGTWQSPITAALCAEKPEGLMGAFLFEPQTDGEALYWLSPRPAEGGRIALMRWAFDGAPQELVGPPWNLRSRVNEYGGGVFAVTGDRVCFVNFDDQRLYIVKAGDEPEPLTADGPYRYGDIIYDPTRSRLICIREDHTLVGQGETEQRTELVAIDLANGEANVLFKGSDFVSSPRLSPSGAELAWVAWDHPNMPWDETRLHRARFKDDAALDAIETEASQTPEARMQPLWSPGGALHYISDTEEWWALHCWPADADRGCQLTHMEAEIGAPAWLLGARHFDFLDDERAVIVFTSNGYWRVGVVSLTDGALLDQSEDMAVLTSVTVVDGVAYVSGADALGWSGFYEYKDGTLKQIIGASASEGIGADVPVSVAQWREAPVPESEITRPDETCAYWFYPPTSASFEPLANERPPVIVQFHGGPTAAAPSSYSLTRQFWTSRGFAVLDVNYRGSSGQGRAYRRRLYGGFGVLEVEDAVAALRHASDLGLVDPSRSIVTGASAGGCVTLATLAFHDAFTLGVNLFGVSDLRVFLENPHKFESRFLTSLIGSTSDEALIYQRSPISGLKNITVPLMTLQGSDDPIVPPKQSHIVMDAVRAQGTPCAYVEYPGEGHGFRSKEVIRHSLETTLSFIAQVLGFQPADDIRPVEIDNFSKGLETMGDRT